MKAKEEYPPLNLTSTDRAWFDNLHLRHVTTRESSVGSRLQQCFGDCSGEAVNSVESSLRQGSLAAWFRRD